MTLSRRAWISVLGLALGGALVQAQPRRIGPPAGPKAMRGPVRKAPRARQNMIDHLMSLPPEQQQEFMRNNPRFRNLPPRQQENIQRRLEEFNHLPPARREALRERYELFRQLSPEQQEQARALYRQWSQQPPDRRQQMMREFRQLRDASPEERRQRLESEDFRNSYSDREQQTLRGLVDLIPDPQ